MDQPLTKMTAAMLAERVVIGALATLAPGYTFRIFGAPPEADTSAVRYMARLFGVRNALLGLLLWQAREDPQRLRQLAGFNAATEALDAAAAALVLTGEDQQLKRAATSAIVTSLTGMAAFLLLRAEASDLARDSEPIVAS